MLHELLFLLVSFAVVKFYSVTFRLRYGCIPMRYSHLWVLLKWKQSSKSNPRQQTVVLYKPHSLQILQLDTHSFFPSTSLISHRQGTTSELKGNPRIVSDQVRQSMLRFVFLNFSFVCQSISACLKVNRPRIVIVYCYNKHWMISEWSNCIFKVFFIKVQQLKKISLSSRLVE